MNALEFLEHIYQEGTYAYPRFYKMDTLSKLGFLASEILLKGIDLSQLKPEETGIILSNANASLDTDYKYYKSTKEIPSPALFVYTLPNIMIGEICIRRNFKGENAFFVSKSFDPGFLVNYVDYLINNNILRSCICGWVDLLHEDYKAMLVLVQRVPNNQSGSLLFDKENLEKLYSLDNG